MNDLERT